MKDLELHIEKINSATSPEEAFESFCSIMQQYGYDRVAYSLITDHPSLSLPKQHGLATSYPEDWMKFYTEKNYLPDDPVVLAIMKSRTPFFWSDLPDDPKIPETSLKILQQGNEAGVKDGIGIPLFGKTGEVVGVGLARKETEDGQNYQLLAGAYLLSVYFHEVFRDMIMNPVKANITDREKEVLSWAAEGKTDDVIATLLNISENTVRYHWKNIFKKLEANSRIYAVTKAIRLEIIVPHLVMTPYQKQ